MQMLGLLCEHNADNDAVHVARAANIVRRDMFKMVNKFSGSFETTCQQDSVCTSISIGVSCYGVEWT